MHRFVALISLVSFLGFAVPAKAELIVEIGNLALPQGSTSFVDVFIRSTSAETPNPDILNRFGAEILIEDTPGVRRIEFVSDAMGNALDPQLSNPSYLFFGDSAVTEVGLLAGIIDDVNNPKDTYFGGDGTFFTTGVIVPATDRLLIRLAVTAATMNPPNVGDVFTLSLQDGNFFTEFLDPDAIALPYNTTFGTVTITAGSVPPPPPPPPPPEPVVGAPEPGSLILFGLGSLGLIGYAWRRRVVVR